MAEGGPIVEDVVVGRSAAEPSITIRLARLDIADGMYTLEDRSTEPVLTLSGSGFRLAAERIDTAGGTPMTVDLATAIGDVDPFRALPMLDVEVGIADLPLRPLNPAAAPKLGYVIENGRLSMTLPIRLEENQFDGDLYARLSNFHLGEKVESESAPWASARP